jgi:quinol monooxygenase YgiN
VAAGRCSTEIDESDQVCLVFTVNRAVENPDEFVLYELYRDVGAFEEHVASDHYRHNIQERVRPLLQVREVSFHVPVEP